MGLHLHGGSRTAGPDCPPRPPAAYRLAPASVVAAASALTANRVAPRVLTPLSPPPSLPSFPRRTASGPAARAVHPPDPTGPEPDRVPPRIRLAVRRQILR